MYARRGCVFQYLLLSSSVSDESTSVHEAWIDRARGGATSGDHWWAFSFKFQSEGRGSLAAGRRADECECHRSVVSRGSRFCLSSVYASSCASVWRVLRRPSRRYETVPVIKARAPSFGAEEHPYYQPRSLRHSWRRKTRLMVSSGVVNERLHAEDACFYICYSRAVTAVTRAHYILRCV